MLRCRFPQKSRDNLVCERSEIVAETSESAKAEPLAFTGMT